jgi:class 3 adenylate cyclase
MSRGRPGATVTVLFTDLVGSTEMMARLGDTAFDGLRGEHFSRPRKVMTTWRGEEVKNTGDGLLVTFASASVRQWNSCRDASAESEKQVQVAIYWLVTPSTPTPPIACEKVSSDR